MVKTKYGIIASVLKSYLKNAYLDIMDLLSGNREEFAPPRRLVFVGDGDFKKTGEEFFKYFVELGGLKPHHKVLDVGCGIGRMAIPLIKYLESGSYEGFDIVPKGIEWSNKTITAKYSNFHFQLIDVYNKLYNAKGKYISSEYKFPFSDESFDFVFLTSVFTHMLPKDMNNYFSNITRVLKRKGRAFITYFLINEDSLKSIGKNLSTLEFKYQEGDYWTTSPNKPEKAIAYEEKYIKDLYDKNDIKIIEPIHYGSWCGRKQYLSYQDILIAEKN
jgi:ubiquinone/menaquinone biosynthesis C-methylase UbiE